MTGEHIHVDGFPTRFSLQGHLLLHHQMVSGGVVVEAGRIAEIRRGAQVADLPSPVVQACMISPGFLDLQVNGGYGIDIGDDRDSLRMLARRLPESGVTAFLATLVTSPDTMYPRFFDALRETPGTPGASVLGAHLEGPLLSPSRPGMHPLKLIETASASALDDLLDCDLVRLITLAPERAGATRVIRESAGRGVTVSLGHTDATYEEMVAGFDAGATMTTHLYNAMRPFDHRSPGPIAAALLDDRVTIGLVADGTHSHPAAVQLAVRAKGTDGIVLVTDMMAAAGMPPGTYSLGDTRVHWDGVRATLPDGTIAGSVATLDACVRNVIKWCGLSVSQAIRMVTENPYRAIGQNGGRIEVGMPADLVLLDEPFQVQATFVRGVPMYWRQPSPVRHGP